MRTQEENDLPSSVLDQFIGRSVRKMREAAGLTLDQLSEKMRAAGRPMTGGRLGALERGEHKWTTRDQYAAATALGLGAEGAALLMLAPESEAASLLSAFLTGGSPAVAV